MTLSELQAVSEAIANRAEAKLRIAGSILAKQRAPMSTAARAYTCYRCARSITGAVYRSEWRLFDRECMELSKREAAAYLGLPYEPAMFPWIAEVSR